jgi:hypothetical protein
MAEEKKDAKPKPSATGGLSGIETIIGLLLILAIVGTLGQRLYALISTGEVTFFGISISNAWQDFKQNLPTIRIISYVISAVFAFGTVVFSQLRGTILITEKKKLFPLGEPKVGGVPVEVKNPMTDKWRDVKAHIESEHPSDWRQAIIEADVMLSDLLQKLNLHGDTMGDKMKTVEKSDFVTIDLAWEAHKVRNQIAHEGSEFLFNQREARRVIDLYRQVFEEFYMI